MTNKLTEALESKDAFAALAICESLGLVAGPNARGFDGIVDCITTFDRCTKSGNIKIARAALHSAMVQASAKVGA